MIELDRLLSKRTGRCEPAASPTRCAQRTDVAVVAEGLIDTSAAARGPHAEINRPSRPVDRRGPHGLLRHARLGRPEASRSATPASPEPISSCVLMGARVSLRQLTAPQSCSYP
jgi:hypothetical protein